MHPGKINSTMVRKSVAQFTVVLKNMLRNAIHEGMQHQSWKGNVTVWHFHTSQTNWRVIWVELGNCFLRSTSSARKKKFWKKKNCDIDTSNLESSFSQETWERMLKMLKYFFLTAFKEKKKTTCQLFISKQHFSFWNQHIIRTTGKKIRGQNNQKPKLNMHSWSETNFLFWFC